VSVTAPKGFVASGVAAGLKAGGRADVALVATDDGRAVPAAAVFTANLAAAAPVQVSRRHLAESGGRVAAVVLSAGNANAATGEAGVAAAERLCALVAEGLGARAEEVLIGQTGLIGIPFPLQLAEAATAIMTTDTVAKEVVVQGDGFVVGGMAKGAAMLAPNMATMLAVLTTDAQVDADDLGPILAAAVGPSFNAMTVDGCTSTNDTVVLLASGRAGAAPREAFAEAVGEATRHLAEAMAADAEGATKVVHVAVSGARSDEEAHRAARKVADSLLVKCSFNGADPYFGRVLSELGTAGVAFDLDRAQVAYGGIVVCDKGVAVDHDGPAVAAHMAGRQIELACELGLGSGSSVVLTTDLGYGYIDENRTTS